MSRPRDVVVVGAGQAGFQLAASLRDEGFDGRVTLVGDEPAMPYQRPPLSKAYLTGKMDADALLLRNDAYYDDHAIDVRRSVTALSIDRGAARVELSTGERLPYDHLVLATGSRNRPLPVPGAEHDGVVQLRTLADAAAIRTRLAGMRRACVIGAGFIGLEFAAVAASMGVEVTVVEALQRPMARAVSRTMADAFTAAHEASGVRFAWESTVVRLHGDGSRVAAVETADGSTTEADTVVVAIGVVPNLELAAAAGLAVGNGILVDDLLAASDPAISAIGDCAAFPSPYADGAIVRLESVQNGVDQARCVAARLLGRPRPYAATPWFWSDQGGLKLQLAGLGMPHDQAVVRGDAASTAFSVFCFRNGHLAGVESVNRAADHMVGRRLLAHHAPLSPEDAADPGFDLKALASAAAPLG